MNELFNTERYILDANTFITSKNDFYRFDTFIGFWDFLLDANAHGLVYSISAVRNELSNEKDQLSRWLRHYGGKFFLSPDTLVTNSAAKIAKWVDEHPLYIPAAKQDFLSKADFMLLAHAEAHGFRVVTFEKDEPDRIAYIKIPTVGNQFGVKCVNVYQMLSDLKAKLVLDRKNQNKPLP